MGKRKRTVRDGFFEWLKGIGNEIIFISVAVRVILIILFVAGIFLWLYVFALGDQTCRQILFIEIIVSIIILAGCLYGICRLGYEDNLWLNIKLNYLISFILSMIGFYISRIPIISRPDSARAEVLFYVIQFIVYALISASMAMIPVLVICVLIWIIMKIFGRP